MGVAKNLNDLVKHQQRKRRIGIIGIIIFVLVFGALGLFIFRSSIFDLRQQRSLHYKLTDEHIRINIEAGLDGVYISTNDYDSNELSISYSDENDDYQIYWEGNELTIRNKREKLPLLVDDSNSYLNVVLSADLFVEDLRASGDKVIDLDNLRMGSFTITVSENDRCKDRSVYMANCEAESVAVTVAGDVYITKSVLGDGSIKVEGDEYSGLSLVDCEFGNMEIFSNQGAYIQNCRFQRALINLEGADSWSMIDNVLFDHLRVNCAGGLALSLPGEREDYRDSLEVVCSNLNIEYVAQETYG